MNKIIIKRYDSKFFPWAVTTKNFCSVFETLESAKIYALMRFGRIDKIKE